MNKILNKQAFLYFLIFLSSISLLKNCIQALSWSSDFQWFPSTLVLKGINHYNYFLDGGQPFMSQGGEYSHGMYIILLPFASLDWQLAKLVWMFFNVFFVIAIPYLICNKFKIQRHLTIIIICIFATCSPTRTVINYGQQSLFVMFFFILPFIFQNNKSYFFSGLSFFKYNTGFILPIFYLVEKKYKYLLLSAIPSIVTWILYFNITNSNPIINLFEPIKLVLSKNYSWGTDLYSITKSLINFEKSFMFLTPEQINSLVSISITLFLCLIFLIKIIKLKDDLLKLSLISLCTLVLAPHSNYDFIFLLPLLIFSIKDFNSNKFNFYLIIFYFYFNKIVRHKLGFEVAEINTYNVCLFLIFFYCLIYNLYKFCKMDNNLKNSEI